jgi:ABC-type transport system involved in multi-copper enzyme maturation permease subunit
MFTAAAFVSDAALRDVASGFATVTEATPAPARQVRLGRFTGACAALATCFLSVPGALLFGSALPQAQAGPALPGAYLFGLAALALPNLLLSACLFFALATASRSLGAAMLGAVALLVLYGMAGAGGAVPPLLEPFGFAAFEAAVAHLPPHDRDAVTPPLDKGLILNRLLWCGIGLAVAAAAIIRAPARAPSVRTAARTRDGGPPPPSPQPRSASFTARTAAAQFAERTRLEVGQVVTTPVFVVLLLLALANVAGTLWAPGPAPEPGRAVELLAGAMRLVPTVVALFFAGELRWSERERRMHALVGSAPLPDAAFLLPKLLALAAVMLGLALATAAAAFLVQLGRGGAVEGGSLLAAYALGSAFDWTLVAVLALFFQALAPNKLAGWGLMVLYLIVSLALQRLGLDDPLYRYGRYPGWPLPGAVSGAEGAPLYRAYWAAFALLLATLAVVLVGRGGDDPLRLRVAHLGARLRGPTAWSAAAGAAAFAALGVLAASRN